MKEQINQLTSFTDATNVYGTSEELLELLRDKNDRTKMLVEKPNSGFGDMIPTLNSPSMKNSQFAQKNFKIENFLNEQRLGAFVAGDTRCSENVMLSSWHTMLVRFHNLAAENLKKEMTHKSSEDIFWAAREFTIAVYNHIIYGEFLPQLFGVQNFVRMRPLFPTQPGADPFRTFLRAPPRVRRAEPPNGKGHVLPHRTDPRIRNEFATATFRWGHAMQPNNFEARDVFFNHEESRLLRSNYFDPQLLHRRSPGSLMRGGMSVRGSAAGPKWVDDTIHFFFQPDRFPHGVDLRAINIARGRDHGVNTYTVVRDFFKNHAEYKFLYPADGSNPPMREGWSELIKMYNGRENEIDLYVGMLMEESKPGSAGLGPTIIASNAEQFVALKHGDSKWWENRNGPFTAGQVNQIKRMSLAKLMCMAFEEEDFPVVSRFPFLTIGEKFLGVENTRVSCAQAFRDLNFNQWNRSPTAAPTTTQSTTTTPTTTTTTTTT